VVFRGDRDSREFIAFWLADGRVVATLNANVWDVVDDLQALIRSGAVVEPARLADQDTPLTELIGTR
jgi:3-phenylpropionate/trans-cinnamate dioxygenase ferredoxin reductase subunit